MPNGLFNWTFRDIEKVLKSAGFVYTHAQGSHYFYRGVVRSVIRIVQVPYHGSNAVIKPKTVKGIIAQSSMNKKKWGI